MEVRAQAVEMSTAFRALRSMSLILTRLFRTGESVVISSDDLSSHYASCRHVVMSSCRRVEVGLLFPGS